MTPPTIVCTNLATTPLGVDWDALIAAMQRYVNEHLAPAWGVSATLIDGGTNHDLVLQPDQWAMVFLDDADVAGALAYHDLTPDGQPISKVFVRTTLANGDLVPVSASHELAEMLADPYINLMCTGPDPAIIYGYEDADPVEALSFAIDGIQMSDFVYPTYFESFRTVGPFDEMDRVREPFEILDGGYQIVLRDGQWTNMATATKLAALAREDRRGHRSETRKARWTGRSTG